MEVAKASTASFTENSATVEDTGLRCSQETQTTEVSYECKIVHTHRPQFCNIGVLTDESNFFDEINFLSDDANDANDAKVHYYTGFANCD